MGLPANPWVVRRLGRVDYAATLADMQAFTAGRGPDTPDEVWLLEHPPVFTLGQAGKPEHLLRDIGIPVVKIDRGGQITYHGPGQVVVYVLLDLTRKGFKVRELVHRLEQAVIDLLAAHGHLAERRESAPGVYVGGAKIASLGLRIRHGCCYHGLSLNVDLDTAPFAAINPCGYPGLAVTRTADLGIPGGVARLGEELLEHLCHHLNPVDHTLETRHG